MPPRKRRSLLARRRRHDDEGEDDGSAVGDVQEYATTEGSLTSGPEDDIDLSGESADEGLAQSMPLPTKSHSQDQSKKHSKDPVFQITADTEAMLNGLKLSETIEHEELHFDDTISQEMPRSKSQPIESTKHKSAIQPPPPSTRKGYFLHDDRTGNQPNTLQPSYKGRNRMFSNFSNKGYASTSKSGEMTNPHQYSAPEQLESDTSKQWAHDLHETINKPEPLPPVAAPTLPVVKVADVPNRDFSTTTILGNVIIQVSLPGVERKTNFNVVKKHYTLLPQHRPPLRRDKPVRISIPDEHARYIFPSTDRSFIFIPRALRPNQQSARGRGRGSFHGSRRTSMYAASAYTPSIIMSRKSSITASGPGSGIHTPIGMPLPSSQLSTAQRPVVRMPDQSIFPATVNTEVFMGEDAAIIHSPPNDLNLEHPRPKKTISVGDIESPSIQAPQQQSQVPFHQQMPSTMNFSELQQKMAQNTPLTNIPEGAVYAQPFQPYLASHHPGFYGMHYPTQMMMPMSDNMGYPIGTGGPVLGPQQAPLPDQVQRSGPVAHETNGMVYYYDPSQQAMPQFSAPMMGMMQSSPYFYPPVQNPMFYQ